MKKPIQEDKRRLSQWIRDFVSIYCQINEGAVNAVDTGQVTLVLPYDVMKVLINARVIECGKEPYFFWFGGSGPAIIKVEAGTNNFEVALKKKE